MFGLTIVSKSYLKDLEKTRVCYHSVVLCYRWFSGWKDLDIIWDYVLSKNQMTIERARREYADARGTDEYGQPRANAPEENR